MRSVLLDDELDALGPTGGTLDFQNEVRRHARHVARVYDYAPHDIEAQLLDELMRDPQLLAEIENLRVLDGCRQ